MARHEPRRHFALIDALVMRSNWIVNRGSALSIGLALMSLLVPADALAQVNPLTMSPMVLAQASPSVPSPGILPTDITPTPIGEERQIYNPGLTFYLSQHLPSRLSFSASTEESQRFESNVFLTTGHTRQDYVFRSLPNVTIGYDIAPHTTAYFNYFVIKDVYADHGILSKPTFQSLSGGVRHDFALGRKTNLQLDYQVRELWQAQDLHQADMLPAITLTRAVSPSLVVYANSILQMRSYQIFQGPTREIDPFYTVGGVYRRGAWNFSTSATLVTNFRNHTAIPPVSNNAIIADFEIARPVNKKVPWLVAFIRAEPIWNWDSHSFPGISGFDFRLFSGLRMSVSRQSYYGQMNSMLQQMRDSIKMEEESPPSSAPPVNAPAPLNPFPPQT